VFESVKCWVHCLPCWIAVLQKITRRQFDWSVVSGGRPAVWPSTCMWTELCVATTQSSQLTLTHAARDRHSHSAPQIKSHKHRTWRHVTEMKVRWRRAQSRRRLQQCNKWIITLYRSPSRRQLVHSHLPPNTETVRQQPDDKQVL